MVYKGQVKNGVVVIEGESRPPEGAAVKVSVVVETPVPNGDDVDRSSLRRLLLSVAGKAQGLPPDAAKNIDHYLYGLPKVDE